MVVHIQAATPGTHSGDHAWYTFRRLRVVHISTVNDIRPTWNNKSPAWDQEGQLRISLCLYFAQEGNARCSLHTGFLHRCFQLGGVDEFLCAFH